MPVSFGNLIIVQQIIAIDVMNDVRRLYSGGALSSALFLKKVTFLGLLLLKILVVFSYELPTLRFGRPVTRLTVHWAFSLVLKSKI